MNRTALALTILYVADLPRSTAFYDQVLGLEKTVDVPVYVEYRLNDGARLGLMVRENAGQFLGPELGGLRPSDGCPRVELYLHVSQLERRLATLDALGAPCTSPLAERDWGDRAAYYLDPDGHVLALAEPIAGSR